MCYMLSLLCLVKVYRSHLGESTFNFSLFMYASVGSLLLVT